MKTEGRGQRAEGRGQTTLELTTALILIMLLLVGSVKIFIWLNERMVRRQIDYENTRVAAANAPHQTVAVVSGDGVTEQNLKIVDTAGGTEVLPDESSYPALDVFGKLN